MTVPYTFATATNTIPLSQLDSNFATAITLGNTAIQLGNTVTTLNNMTLANVTISSGNVTITNVSVTTANVTTLNAATVIATTGNITTVNATTVVATTANATTANITTGNLTDLNLTNNPTFSGGTANGVLYLNGSKVATSGSALTFDGSTLYNSGNISVGGNSGGNRYVAILNETGTYTGTLMLQAGGGSAAYGGAVVMYGHSHASYPGAVYVGSSAGTSTGIIFGGGGNAGPATSEWMRLTSTGLGIGTSSPGAKLDVYSSSLRYVRSYPSSGLADFEVVTNNNSQPVFAVKGTGTADLIRAYSGSTQVLTLDSSGNLGLGVTPSAWGLGKAFEIGIAGNCVWGVQSADLRLGANMRYDGSNYRYVNNGVAARYDVANGTLGGHAWYTAASGTAGNAISFTQAMTLDASGNLLVGDTTSSGRLTVKRSTDGTIGYFDGSTTQFRIDVASSTINLNAQNGTGAMAFQTNGTERARIDSSGNFSVGTAAIATNATDGFLYIPTCAGTPTGTPTAKTGLAPMVIDSTNNKMYIYSGGAWRALN